MIRASEYVKPSTLEEAYQLCQKRSSVAAGGMMWLKMENINKQRIVDLSGLGLEGIQENEEEFCIGAMTTLRMLELHEGLNQRFNGIFRECTRHIVGVQFRNGATVGGSVFGRFGFSDILTALMALDAAVELYQGGILPLDEFISRPRSVKDRDILVRIRIKKDGRQAAYGSLRRTKTDFPLVACCVSKTKEGWTFSAGARPAAARRFFLPGKEQKMTEEERRALACQAAEAFSYGTNYLGSQEYRKYTAGVLFRRLMEEIESGEETEE